MLQSIATNDIDTSQLIDTLSVGEIVLNRRLEIILWNNWMAQYSIEIPEKQSNASDKRRAFSLGAGT